MRKIVIFGNSGSGKSTLAKQLSHDDNLAHLDLDVLAWLPTTPPQRQSLQVSQDRIDEFINANKAWVIEGCYADLLALVANKANEMIFLNPGIDQCINNARNRPWEPHKYKTKQEQDNNLDMLINWIRQYNERTDEFSLQAHQTLYDEFEGRKTLRQQQ